MRFRVNSLWFKVIYVYVCRKIIIKIMAKRICTLKKKLNIKIEVKYIILSNIAFFDCV